MGRRKSVPSEVPAEAIQTEMEAVRAEVARLKRREAELAGRLADRVKVEEAGLLRLLGSVLLRDLDPASLPAEGDGLHGAARRDLGRRSAWFALRIRAAMLDKATRPPLLEGLLARLDDQAGFDRYGAPPRYNEVVTAASEADHRLVSHHG
jgi:hypothetical protein